MAKLSAQSPTGSRARAARAHTCLPGAGRYALELCTSEEDHAARVRPRARRALGVRRPCSARHRASRCPAVPRQKQNSAGGRPCRAVHASGFWAPDWASSSELQSWFAELLPYVPRRGGRAAAEQGPGSACAAARQWPEGIARALDSTRLPGGVDRSSMARAMCVRARTDTRPRGRGCVREATWTTGRLANRYQLRALAGGPSAVPPLLRAPTTSCRRPPAGRPGPGRLRPAARSSRAGASWYPLQWGRVISVSCDDITRTVASGIFPISPYAKRG